MSCCERLIGDQSHEMKNKPGPENKIMTTV